jgi:hypothetical protein
MFCWGDLRYSEPARQEQDGPAPADRAGGTLDLERKRRDLQTEQAGLSLLVAQDVEGFVCVLEERASYLRDLLSETTDPSLMMEAAKRVLADLATHDWHRAKAVLARHKEATRELAKLES